MTNSFFAFISRMKYINRWGLMHNSRYENLSEHSFETAYLANALANIENAMFGGDYNADRITTLALFHDSAEIITGDMPTPVKYKHRRMSDAYTETEDYAKSILLDSLPDKLRVIYKDALSGGDEKEHLLIKAADKLSALIKCEEELTIGNRDFASARESVRGTLEKSTLPSVKYFLDEILPLYRLTLDELSDKGETEI